MTRLKSLWQHQEVKAAAFIAVPAIIGAALGIKLALPDGIWPASPGQPVAISTSSRKEPLSTRPKSSAEISGGMAPPADPQRSPTSQTPPTQPAPKAPPDAGPASTASSLPTEPSSGLTSSPSTLPTPSTPQPTLTSRTTTSSQPESKEATH